MLHTGNIQQLILTKILKSILVDSDKHFHGVARGPIRQRTDNMPAKLALLDAVVVEETKDVRVFLTAVDSHQQFKHFFFMAELQMLAVLCPLCRQRSEQFVKRIFYAVFLQLLQPMHRALVDVEGKSHHLRKSEVGIVPFVDIVLV